MNFQKYLTENTDFKQQWQKYISTNPLLAAGVDVLKIIGKDGGKAFIVGGAVRDIIMGKRPHDIDITTSHPMDKLEKLFSTYDIGKNRDFGILLIKHKGLTFEIAQMRSDGSYVDGRRPETVHLNVPIEKDLARRDATLNAMAVDQEGNIIDHFEGLKAIKDKVWKAVGDPELRFKEDHLRMLRAVRQSAALDFSIDPDTKVAIEKHKSSLALLSPERIKDEIMKMSTGTGAKFANALKLLDDVGILDIILPEIKKLQTTKETPEHHPEAYANGGKGTVWDHTLAALSMNTIKDPLINLSILLHDVGKPDTYKYEDGKHKYPGHAEQAASIIDTLAKRLKLSNKERDAIMFSALNHMKLFRGDTMKPSKIIKLVNDERWNVLIATSLADDSCRIGMFNRETFDRVVNDMLAISKKWGEKIAGSMVKVVDGKRVMKMTHLPAGKVLGDLIKKVTAYAVDNGISDDKEVDKLVLKFYKEIE